MSHCPTFDLSKRLGVIRTPARRCELESGCDGSSCRYVPYNALAVIENDPQDAAQDAALMEISGQATLAAITAILHK